VRLRPLTEAECYARCYGGRRGEAVGFAQLPPDHERAASGAGEQLREAVDPSSSAPEPAQGREAA
jgi:hypothetical protein